jgi:hypothetical protein
MRCALSSSLIVIILLGCLSFLSDALFPLESALAAQPATSQPTIQSLYNANRMKEALNACETAIYKRPIDVSLRYWHANILVNLHNFADAKSDYQYVLENSMDVKVKGYCKQALDSLAATAPALSAQINKPSAAPAVSPSVDRITRQADADSNSILMDGTTQQNYFFNRGELEAGNAGDLRTIDAMQRAVVRVGNTSVPRYSPEQIQYQRDLITEKAAQLRAENKGRADAAVQFAQQKVFETQAAAANLASQINSGSKNGFHLKEDGTNFYVRQYNVPQSNSSYTPNPATVTINDSADAQRGKFESPMQATARAFDPTLQKQLDLGSRKTVRSNVFGRLNPPEQTSDQHY